MEPIPLATLGSNTVQLDTGSLITIPAMQPHDLRNIGPGPLRAVGFFSGAVVYSTFLAPEGSNAPDVVTVHGASAAGEVYALQPVADAGASFE